MKKENQFEVEYIDEHERDKLLRKFKRANIPENAIDDDEEGNKLLIDSMYSDVASEVVEKYDTLREKREAKADPL